MGRPVTRCFISRGRSLTEEVKAEDGHCAAGHGGHWPRRVAVCFWGDLGLALCLFIAFRIVFRPQSENSIKLSEANK